MKYLTIILLTFLAFSCKKKQQPEMSKFNKGCDCAEEVTADFLMEERAGDFASGYFYSSTDSIFGNKNVRFTAPEEAGTNYTWYIGNEIITDLQFSRYFPNSMVGQTVPVALVKKRNPNAICFPGDDGYDSVVKYLTIAQASLFENYDTTMLEGTYKVKSPNQGDSVIITLDYKENDIFFSWDIYNFNGLGTNCTGQIFSEDVQLNYREMKILNGGCGSLHGRIRVEPNGQTVFDLYSPAMINGTLVWDGAPFYFEGRRL